MKLKQILMDEDLFNILGILIFLRVKECLKIISVHNKRLIFHEAIKSKCH